MAQHTLIPEENQIEIDPTRGQQLEALSVPDEKPAALHPHEGLGHDELDSSVCGDLTQEVQPGVREPEDTHPSTTEDPDAVPRLALAEEGDNQKQQGQSDQECKNKIQNTLVLHGYYIHDFLFSCSHQ